MPFQAYKTLKIGSTAREQNQFHRNMPRLRGGLAFKARKLCVSLNSRLESNNEEGLHQEWSPSKVDTHLLASHTLFPDPSLQNEEEEEEEVPRVSRTSRRTLRGSI